MKDQVEPFDMNELERRTDAALDQALSPDAVAGDVSALQQRIADATFASLPGHNAVVGRIGRRAATPSRGLSTAWRIAAVLALGMMTALVVAAWQVDTLSPGTVNAATPDPIANDQTAATARVAFDATEPADDDAVFFLALIESDQDTPSAAALDAELDIIALQIEMMLAREVFATPDESLDEAIEQDPFFTYTTENTGLF